MRRDGYILKYRNKEKFFTSMYKMVMYCIYLYDKGYSKKELKYKIGKEGDKFNEDNRLERI